MLVGGVLVRLTCIEMSVHTHLRELLVEAHGVSTLILLPAHEPLQPMLMLESPQPEPETHVEPLDPPVEAEPRTPASERSPAEAELRTPASERSPAEAELRTPASERSPVEAELAELQTPASEHTSLRLFRAGPRLQGCCKNGRYPAMVHQDRPEISMHCTGHEFVAISVWEDHPHWVGVHYGPAHAASLGLERHYLDYCSGPGVLRPGITLQSFHCLEEAEFYLQLQNGNDFSNAIMYFYWERPWEQELSGDEG